MAKWYGAILILVSLHSGSDLDFTSSAPRVSCAARSASVPASASVAVGNTSVSAAATDSNSEQQSMATTAFEDSESLGEAWHAVGGYGGLEALADGHMLMLLQTNPEFALRCARSPPDFFFGPTRGMLRDVALQLRGVWIKERWQRAARKAALLSLCLKEAHAPYFQKLDTLGERRIWLGLNSV